MLTKFKLRERVNYIFRERGGRKGSGGKWALDLEQIYLSPKRSGKRFFKIVFFNKMI